MRAYQIMQGMSPDLGREMLVYFRDGEHREVYTTTVSTLASQKKLRPVFIQKKPKDAQVDWMLKALGQRGADQVAEHLLQLWLMKEHQVILVDFLDGLGIEHDGDGAVEDLPETLEAGKVKSAVDALLAKHPAEPVAVYLHMFQLQSPGGWDALGEEIASREEFALGAAG